MSVAKYMQIDLIRTATRGSATTADAIEKSVLRLTSAFDKTGQKE